MNLDKLKEIYEEFNEFHKEEFKKNIRNRVGINYVRNLSVELIDDVFENYEKRSFLRFCILLRDLWYYGEPFYILKKFNDDSEFLSVFLKFLIKKKLIFIKSEKVRFKVNFKDVFIEPLEERKAYQVLRKKLRKIDNTKSVLENFGFDYCWREGYDQIPITLDSAIFIAKKITDYYPFRDKFIFIGADDFVYLVLSLVDSKIRFKVIDIDEKLLSIVEKLKTDLKLDIDIEKVDVRKNTIKEKFYGTYLNPPYNFSGAISFLRFSSRLIEKEGGFTFLVLGDEAIGNRMLFLQREISRMNFILREIIGGKVSYTFRKVYKECFIFERRFKNFGVNIKDKEYLNASLLILEKIAFKPKKIKIEGEIYSYL